MTNNSPSPARRVLKLAEFAEAIGYSKRHLYRLIELGEVPRPFKIGSRSCYAKEDLDSYIERLKQNPK